MKPLSFVSVSVGLLLCMALPCAGQGLLHGVAAIGDSMTDEYQEASETQTAYNWLEQLAEYRSLNFGTITNNITYEYDYAHRGDETGDLSSQVSNVLGHVASGDVTLVCMMIGNNDLGKQYPTDAPDPKTAMCHNYADIYWGVEDGWTTQVQNMADRVQTAVDDILSANANVKLILATAPDCELNPWYKRTFDIDARRQYVRDAFDEYNRKLIDEVIPNLYDPDRIAVADVYQLSLDWINARNTGQSVMVGGYEINLEGTSNDPDSLIVGDEIHPNTIPQGLIANEFVDAMNELDENLILASFSEAEILNHAGVPEPATCMLMMLGAGVLFRRKGR